MDFHGMIRDSLETFPNGTTAGGYYPPNVGSGFEGGLGYYAQAQSVVWCERKLTGQLLLQTMSHGCF